MRAWLRRRSIRSRLLMVIGAVTSLGMITFGGLALVAEQQAAKRAITGEQEAMALLTASRSAAALLFGDATLAKENLDALNSVPHVQAACLYDTQDRLFAAYVSARNLQCPVDRSAILEAKGDWLQTVVPVVMDEPLGTLYLRSSLQPVQNRLREQSRTWAAAAAVAALLSLLSAALLEGLISGPIRRLGRVIDAIDPTQTGGRRAVADTRDEIGQLALAFNRLLDRLDEQTDRLRVQAEYNEVLFKQSPLPVIVFDPRVQKLVDCNEAAIAIYGLGSREATLDSSAETVSAPVQYDGTPSVDAIGARVEAALSGAPTVYDWRHRRPDGSEFDAEVHMTRFGPSDAPLLLASVFDVTERKTAAAELQRLNEALESRVAERTQDLAVSNSELSATVEQLQRAQTELVRSERLASLGSLVAGVAHELNTPLGSVLLVATTLGDGIDELRQQLACGDLKRSSLAQFLAQQAEAQTLIVRNARRAAELIGRFKQVAVDQTSEHRRRFDLGEVVSEVIETLQPRLRATPHRIELEIAAGLAMDSYPGPLGQVLTNLVMNAVIHGFGAKPGSVRIEAHGLADDELELIVSDDGAGIPAEHLPRIFDPFFTTKLGEGGSGLGLHIVFSLVERSLGGRVEVESHPGQGTRFRLRLPRTAPSAAKH